MNDGNNKKFLAFWVITLIIASGTAYFVGFYASSYTEDSDKFEKFMTKGYKRVADASANKGAANTYSSLAKERFKGGYYALAMSHSEEASKYYDYSYDIYKDVKEYFELASEYSSTEKERKLSENLIILCEWTMGGFEKKQKIYNHYSENNLDVEGLLNDYNNEILPKIEEYQQNVETILQKW